MNMIEAYVEKGYHLQFELDLIVDKFINRNRTAQMPDIDIDFGLGSATGIMQYQQEVMEAAQSLRNLPTMGGYFGLVADMFEQQAVMTANASRRSAIIEPVSLHNLLYLDTENSLDSDLLGEMIPNGLGEREAFVVRGQEQDRVRRNQIRRGIW